MLLAQPIKKNRGSVSAGYFSRIYAFGHSIGGGITALLSLYPELPLRVSASCGGIYVPQTFARWAASSDNAELVLFDPQDVNETQLRVLGPNLAWMVHRHVAYVGDGASDLEAARMAPVVFARSTLLERLTGEYRRLFPFDTFHDIVAVLEREARTWPLNAQENA